MTKHTKQEVIAYLKTLKEGDVLTAVKTREGSFRKGKEYIVEKDEDDDLFITNDIGCGRFVHVGSDYECTLKGFFDNGIFEIPTEKTQVKDVIYIADVKRDRSGEITVSVRCNNAGLEILREVEIKSYNRNRLVELREQSAKLDEEIAGLEEVLAE